MFLLPLVSSHLPRRPHLLLTLLLTLLRFALFLCSLTRSFLFQLSHSLNKLPSVVGTRYGGRHTATLIPGDGIGREMTDAVRTVFKAAHVPVEWEVVHLHPDQAGKVDLQKAYDSLRRNKVGLKGKKLSLWHCALGVSSSVFPLSN